MTNKLGKALIVFTILLALTMPALAAPPDGEARRIYEGLYESFGGGEIERVLPEGARPLLEGMPDAGGITRALSLRSLVNMLSGGLYNVLREALGSFARIMLIVLVFVLAEELRDSLDAEFAAGAVSLTAVLCVSLAAYGVIGGAVADCIESLREASALLDVAIPVIAAAGAAGGRVISSMVLPGAMAVVISLFGKLNTNLLMPVVSVYFALSLASALTPKSALSGICKAIKETAVFAMGLFTTIAAGLLSLQKIVAGASESLAIDAAKFTLGSVIPVVGGIITDALETVLGCVDVIRASVGVAGVVGLLLLMAPPLIRVLLYSFFFKLAAAAASLAGEGGVPTFLSAVADVWSILAAVTICQSIYLITATAMMAG